MKIISHPCRNAYYQENRQQRLLGHMGKITVLHCYWEYKITRSLWNSEWKFQNKIKPTKHQTLNIELQCGPAAMLLRCVYQTESMWTHSKRLHTCLLWHKLQVMQWTWVDRGKHNKLWHINEIMSFAEKWMEFYIWYHTKQNKPYPKRHMPHVIFWVYILFIFIFLWIVLCLL